MKFSRTQRRLGLGGLVLVTVAVVMGFLGSRAGRPAGLGVHQGQLAPCPSSPNCVSSMASDPRHALPPLPVTGAAPQAMQRLQAIVAGQPGARVVSVDERYLHAEFTSRIFRFVDDVEFLLDEGEDGGQAVIHFRSASRVGHWDLGANRRRMETIGKLFAEQPADPPGQP